MLASIILSIFSIVPALVLWIYSIKIMLGRTSLISNGIETMGSIIEWTYHSYFNIKGLDFYYSPVIKFLDDKNQEITFESNYRTSIGKMWSNIRFSDNKIKVIYNKENPLECEMKSFSSLWGIVITPLLLAVIFSIVAILAVKDLLIVNLSVEKIFAVTLDQLIICVMLLVLFIGILLLWDLFNDPYSNTTPKENVKVENKKNKK